MHRQGLPLGIEDLLIARCYGSAAESTKMRNNRVTCIRTTQRANRKTQPAQCYALIREAGRLPSAVAPAAKGNTGSYCRARPQYVALQPTTPMEQRSTRVRPPASRLFLAVYSASRHARHSRSNP